jgi:hypothetical protein
MKKLIYIFLVFSFFACGVRKEIQYVPVTNNVYIRDSFVVKDTIIKYQIQYQNVVAVKQSHLSTDLASSDASIDSVGLLHHSIKNNGLIPSKIIYKTKDSIVSKEIPIEVVKTVSVEKKLNQMQSFLIWSGVIAWIYLLFRIVMFLRKVLYL